MDSNSSPQSLSVNLFYQNYLLKTRGLSHSSLHKSGSDFFRKSTEDFHVVFDRNLAESRYTPSVDDELILSMYNELLDVVIESWEGKSSVKFVSEIQIYISI